MEPEKALVVFQGKKIRRTWFNDEWYFSIIDVVNAVNSHQSETGGFLKLTGVAA